ncbi:MAG: peptide chain release factor N(5)-glutamine methyltransferase [Bacteroidota bacterium]|nr:peptide chain release factor N(5)-glutamine methyltransferase [Bacteroidota bacterium]
MYSTKNLFQQTQQKLENFYDKDESKELSMLIVSYLSGCNRSEILADKQIKNFDEDKLNDYIIRLQRFEPIQYIIGFTYFYGYRFEVNKSVFIPRPETEELVQLILHENKSKSTTTILDIGTGSGCIPISLALENPNFKVYALEVSKAALKTAKQNAENNHAAVEFIHHDINNIKVEYDLPLLDIIVSNPPYITVEEKSTLQSNVVDYEPHIALFSTEQDPIHFYKKIVEFATGHLKSGGKLYFEINQELGENVKDHMIASHFVDTIITKDINNNNRFVSGTYQS